MNLQSAQVEQWEKARVLVKQGKREEASRAFQQLLQKVPNHPHLLLEAGKAAKAVQDLPLAVRHFKSAARHAGKDAKFLISLGRSFMQLHHEDEGLQCLQSAIASDPNAIDAISDLTRFYERRGQAEKAYEYLEPYLKKFPQHLTARYLQAFLLQRSGQFSEAESILQDLVRGEIHNNRTYLSCFYLLADILDKTQRPAEAMELLLKVKELVLRNPDFQTTLEHYDKGVEQRNQLLDTFTPELIRSWQDREPFHPQDRSVAFLGGHPRSGTTLLERVLDSHPQLTAFDENDAFYRSIDSFLRRYGPDHPDFGNVTSEYRKQLLLELDGECDSRVLLDKNPSLTACLHSWLVAIPGVKVVIALRHPMDVMLSCFFLDLPLNSINSNFLSFERISKHYRDMMDVWLRLRDMGGFEWMESRYEDTVSDLATEGRRVTEFLGLEWQEQQTNFHLIQQQTRVTAPTYHDVKKPVHQRSMQRWLKYESHLSPHMKELEPYMKRLGYA